jgi:hypothetical protein
MTLASVNGRMITGGLILTVIYHTIRELNTIKQGLENVFSDDLKILFFRVTLEI